MTFHIVMKNIKLILLLEVRNISTTTLTHLIFKVIVKTLYVTFFSPADLVFFHLVTVLSSFSIALFLSSFVHPTSDSKNIGIKICNKAVANYHNTVQCDKCST